jgi:hypothetical protein
MMGNEINKENEDLNEFEYSIPPPQSLPIHYLYPPQSDFKTEWYPTEYVFKKQVFIKKKIKNFKKSKLKLFP